MGHDLCRHSTINKHRYGNIFPGQHKIDKLKGFLLMYGM